MAAAPCLCVASRLRAAPAWARLLVRGVAGPPGPGPGLGDLEHDPDADWEPERELQELERNLKQQKKQIRYYKICRQMEASGAPQRTLTRNAMEQIRYLHKEFSEDWTITRLAEGFGVSTDVIRRVLKSKFVPTLKQEIRQDKKIVSKAKIIHHPQTQLDLQEPSLLPASTGHLVSESLPVSGFEALSQGHGRGQDYGSALQEKEKNLQAWETPKSQNVRDKVCQKLGKEKHTAPYADLHLKKQRVVSTPRKQKQPDGSHTDGLLNKEKEEVLKAPETGDKEFSCKVFQKGREFFDSNGNFLYRI